MADFQNRLICRMFNALKQLSAQNNSNFLLKWFWHVFGIFNV